MWLDKCFEKQTKNRSYIARKRSSHMTKTDYVIFRKTS